MPERNVSFTVYPDTGIIRPPVQTQTAARTQQFRTLKLFNDPEYKAKEKTGNRTPRACRGVCF